MMTQNPLPMALLWKEPAGCYCNEPLRQLLNLDNTQTLGPLTNLARERASGVHWFGPIALSLHFAQIPSESSPDAGTLVTCVDVTAQKMTEARLKKSEDQYRAVTELSPQLVWMADAHGAITYSNQTQLDFLGLTQDQINGDRWLEALHPDDRDRAIHIWMEATSKRQSYSTEFRVQRADGVYRWLFAMARPVFDESQAISGWIGVSIDIHDRKIIEQELHRAKDEAERANQLKSTFLANMSHEIRTPLGAMLGFADILKDPSLSESDRVHYLDILTRNGEQLSTIINDILDLSKVEAGFLSFEKRETQPLQLAFEVVSLLSVKAQAKGIALEVHALPGVPETIVSDPVRLKQILLNIVGNAVKFTSSGSVQIFLSGCTNPAGGLGLRFEVKDTGIGLSSEAASGLFQLFHQGDASTSRRFGGTGLGLALSRRLARALGGDVILLASRPNLGSTFVIDVASMGEIEATPKVAVPPRQTDLSLKNKRVLVVEDSPDNQKLIHHILLKQGAIVELAADGEQGVQKALNGHFDVVLMDIQMPVMDGYTATQKLRRLGYPGPVIALTAHAMSEVRHKALSVGYTDHLPKPIHAPELIAAISKYASSVVLSTREHPRLDF